MNRGSITKKSTKSGVRWYVVLDLGRDPGTSKRRRKWYGGFATKREAVAALAALQGERSRGLYVEPSQQSLDAFLDEWLPAIQSTVRPGTFKSYSDVLGHARRRIGGVALRDLGPMQLNALYTELLASGRHDGRGGLAPRTVRYCHTVLRRALRDAVRWGKLARNPADLADPPKGGSRTTMRVWDAAQVRHFLATIGEDRLYAAFLLTAATGMRRGEVLGLRWTDVDLDHGRLAISQTWVSIGYDMQLSTPKTARSRRRIDLDAGTVAALRAHRLRQVAERAAWPGVWSDTGFVFTREDGSPIHPQSLSAAFERAVKAAGLPKIRFHDLRHTHATLLQMRGVAFGASFSGSCDRCAVRVLGFWRSAAAA